MAEHHLCSIDGCDNPVRGRGFCNKHYQRFQTYGDPHFTKRVSRGTVPKWIEDHVAYSGDDCLPWPFSKVGGVPGNINLGGRYVGARNHITTLAHGPAPTDQHIAAHTHGPDDCGCMNPRHLRWILPGGEPARTFRAMIEADVLEIKDDPKDACCLVGCDRAKSKLGLCLSHYKRLLKHGDPHGGRTFRGEAVQWLRDHVHHVDPDECLIWPFGRSANGYAVIDKKHGSGSAHRVMCIWAHGEPPSPEHEAAHSCGNGHIGCVNPHHLLWKTHAENMQDVFVHGTHNRGERNGMHILTEAQVLEIKRLVYTIPHPDIASRFGITPAHVSAIATGLIWDWLEAA